jgi:hypothetical protein
LNDRPLSNEELDDELQSRKSSDPEEDQLMGPAGWRPSLQDLEHQKTSFLIEDLPIEALQSSHALGTVLMQTSETLVQSISDTLTAVERRLWEQQQTYFVNLDDDEEHLESLPAESQPKVVADWSQIDEHYFKVIDTALCNH